MAVMVTSTALAVSAASAVPIMPVSRGLPMALLAVLACLLAGALVLLKRRICVPALACDAMPDAGAGLISGWLMHLTNRGLYHELERSSRLARRKWLLPLPLCGHGWQTLVSRAILVHLRRFEGLGDILLFAGVYVPLLCSLCLGVLGLQLLVPCVAAVVLNYRAAAEFVRVFRADEDNRLVLAGGVAISRGRDMGA